MSGMTIDNWGLKFGNTIRDWVIYNIGFSKAATFITGLIFSHALVDYAVVSPLIEYITDHWKASLPKAAAVVNVKEGVTSLMAIVSAHISDAYLGRFKMVLSTAAAYTSGLVLLYISASKKLPKAEVPLFYVALLLIALGKAGREPPLKAFLADQFKADQDNDEIRAESRRKTWWRSFGFLGIFVAVFVLSLVSWPNTYKISAIVMGATYVVFLCGISFYDCSNPTGSPLTLVFGVFVAATLKRHLDFPLDPKELHQKPSLENHHHVMLPRTRWLRWLYKAAIVESSPPTKEEQEQIGRLFTMTQVEETKLLLEMIPMWSTFLGYSLVKTTGSTFFIEQATNMRTEVPIAILFVIKSFSSFAISYMYDLLVSKRLTESQRRYATRLRIGVGMLFSIFCCSTAWWVEARRLDFVIQHYLQEDLKENTIPMSIFSLAPQFSLLGIMEGLSEDGLRDFFYDHVSKSMENYGPPFNDCVIGIGGILSVLSVHSSRGFFGDTINKSRLDKYYRNLAIFSYLNLGFYCFIESRYKYKEAAEEVELNTIAVVDAS